jgi:TonB-linked SusC/RagA family outer membrane protein
MKIKLRNVFFYFRKELLLNIMRSFIFLCCITAFSFTSNGVLSQNTKIKIKVDKTLTVDQVFDIIMEQTDYKFIYQEGTFKTFPTIAVKKGIISANDLLQKSLSSGNFNVILSSNNTVIVEKRLEPVIKEQNFKVSGTIIDENGQPLAGANILEKGTTNGAQSDFNGEFSLNVSNGNATLMVSFLGFLPQEFPVNNQTNISITLKEDAAKLDEVVIIGYGSQNKSKITGAVGFVDSEELEDAIFTDVSQVLQGRTAGVNIINGTGEPGSSARIRIRGNNSINGDNNPLWVVDGVPVSGIPSFSPQDIASFEVLKDAAATSIYGARGANGVVIVNTKRGAKGETQINVSSITGFTNALAKFDVLEGQTYAEFRNEVAINAGGAIPFANPSDFVGQGFNWQELISQTGIRQETQVSMSGGGDQMNFFTAVNYVNDKGIFINSKYERANLRANLDFKALGGILDIKVSNALTHTVRNGGSYSEGSNPNSQSQGGIYAAASSEPLVNAIDFSGTASDGLNFFNPYLIFTESQRRRAENRMLSSIQSTLNLAQGLTFTNNSSVDILNSNNGLFTPARLGGQALLVNGNANTDNVQQFNFVISNFLKYSKLFSEKHDFNLLVGQEYNGFNNRSVNTTSQNFSTDDFGLSNLGVAGTQLVRSNRVEANLQSFFGRLDYTFNNRYLFNATYRADGSSRFAKANKWGYFPSFGAAWLVSNENFLDDSKISNLKIRASWGQVGSQAIEPYQSLNQFTSNNVFSTIGNTSTIGIQPSNSAGNKDLKWETTTTFDVGFDLGLFNNALELNVSYYNKRTEDLLQRVNLPAQDGFRDILVNLGEVENKGFEIGVFADIFRNKDFKWSSSFNASFNKSKVLDIGIAPRLFPDDGQAFTNVFVNTNVYEVGQPIGAFYGWVADGLIQASDFDSSGNPTFAPFNGGETLGGSKYVDVIDDGILNIDDRVVIGDPNPDAILGWNNDFSYKNLSLNLFFQASIGNDIANASRYLLTSFLTTNTLQDYYDNRWTPTNPTNDPRNPRAGINNPATFNSSIIEDGSYVRLKNVTLKYNVPLPNNWKTLSAIEVSLTGTNLFTITNYSGLDPEVDSFAERGQGGLFGLDFGTYPTTRMISLGVNAQF